MSERTDDACIQDMLVAARRAVEYCAGMTFEEFIADSRTQDAVVRNIEIMGEAVKGVSEATRQRFEQVPWKSIAGMRDRLIHDYFGVNWDIVWGVVQQDLPQLIAELQALMDESA